MHVGLEQLAKKCQCSVRVYPSALHSSCRLAISLAFFCIATLARGEEPAQPLKPVDLSSPRATLQTFLDSGDAVGAYLAQDYLPSPTRTKFYHVFSLSGTLIDCLDLSEMPPAARLKGGPAAACALYDSLSRIQLPRFDEIPDATQMSGLSGAQSRALGDPEHGNRHRAHEKRTAQRRVSIQRRDCRPGGRVLPTCAGITLYAPGSSRSISRK